MKIQNINYAYKFTNPFSKSNEKLPSPVRNSYNVISPVNQLRSDTVSFKAKNYDKDDILNPTGHCAYCGCKVYSENQIDSLAKEMLTTKAGRLEGKIKSVLEKLTEAKNSQELSLAKRLENEDEIKFFSRFLENASNKSYLKGEAIFHQVDEIDKDKALVMLKKNMHPLLATVDHISPQNEQKDNLNSDINLVEACYCCNHDLKKGVAFDEFYAMFPTIKNNMPVEKFKFAMSNILDFSQESILKRLSAATLLSHLKRLFAQRDEALRNLDSVDFRIKGCKSTINTTVESCKEDIKAKEHEITELKTKHEKLKKDPEYIAIIKRQELLNNIQAEQTAINSLKERKSNLSQAINKNNDINNKKGSKKSKTKQKTSQINQDEKQKIEQKNSELKAELQRCSEQISNNEEMKFNFEVELENLNIDFPTIEMIEFQKSQAERVYNAYKSLDEKHSELELLQAKYDDEDIESTRLETFIGQLPSEGFDVSAYNEDEQNMLSQYQTIKEALEYIVAHPNGGSIKVCIHSAAQDVLQTELQNLKQTKIVKDFLMNEKKKEYKKLAERSNKNKGNIKNQIQVLKEQIRNLTQITTKMSKDEALQKSRQYSEDIRRLTEKQNQVKIPQQISQLQTEIYLIEATIQDLQKKAQEIEESVRI